MKRVLHLIHTPRLSGAETLVRELCLRHQDEGLICGISAFGPAENGFAPSAEALKAAGIELFFPERPLGRIARLSHFRNCYRDFQPDAVFGHSVLPAAYGRIALPVNKRPRFYSVLHSATNDDYANAALCASEWALARRLDGVVAVSDLGAQSYKRRIPLSPPVTVIPNGIDTALFTAAARRRDENRASFGLSTGEKLIIQVGRISPVKQQLFSLQTLHSLLQTCSDIKLWFVGLTEDALYEATLRSAAAAYNLSGQVRLLGSRDDIPQLLSAADACIMPSLQEAHSVAFIEALASGINIVATRIPSFETTGEQPGTVLVEVGNGELFGAECLKAISAPRNSRDMSAFDIGRTSRDYTTVLNRD